MKYQSVKGFVMGVAATASVVALSGTALAISRSITVDDGVKITVDGKALVPKDANGNEVPVFVYEGTTYVPIRAVAEAFQNSVSYDDASRTAVITSTPSTTDKPAAEKEDSQNPAEAGSVDEAKAKQIALDKAGLKEADVKFTKVKLDTEDGKQVYDIEFVSGNKEYSYTVEIASGNITEEGSEVLDDEKNTSASTDLISMEEAKKIVLGRIVGASLTDFTEFKQDTDDGVDVYEGEVSYSGYNYSFKLNAKDGTVISWESGSND